MNNLQELQQYVFRLGWFGGRLKLDITVESEFEGFYGRASETWEHRVTISLNEVKEGDKIVSPAVKVIGKRWQNIDDVAQEVMNRLNKWKENDK